MIFATSLVACCSFVTAATLGTYEFTGTSTADGQFNAVTAQPTGASFSTFTRTNVNWTSTANLFNSTAWNVAVTVDTAEYVQFSFTVDTGYTATLSSLSYFQQGSNTVNDEYRVAYSTNSFATTAGFIDDTVAISPGSSETYNFGSVVLTAGQSISFRFYVFGDTQADGVGVPSAAGTFRFDTISLDGSIVSAVPEPSAYAMMAGGLALASVLVHRRRRAAVKAA
ncbi:MAG: hypothetical protein K0R17_3828 [Rariglobus sp.]|nr:hypothetical protein [Rariglobus sp.]